MRRTLEDPDLWYPVNAYSGWCGLSVGVAEIVVAAALYSVPDLTVALYASIVGGVAVGGVMIALMQCFRYLHRLTKRKDAGKTSASQHLAAAGNDAARRLFDARAAPRPMRGKRDHYVFIGRRLGRPRREMGNAIGPEHGTRNERHETRSSKMGARRSARNALPCVFLSRTDCREGGCAGFGNLTPEV